jgi:hypothetical protein
MTTITKAISLIICSSLFDESVCKLGLFWHEWAFKTLISLAF